MSTVLERATDRVELSDHDADLDRLADMFIASHEDPDEDPGDLVEPTEAELFGVGHDVLFGEDEYDIPAAGNERLRQPNPDPPSAVSHTRSPSKVTAFGSLRAWMEDTSGKMIRTATGQSRVITDGRIARAERQLRQGQPSEEVARSTGISPKVAKLLAKEAAADAIEMPEGREAATKAKNRQHYRAMLQCGRSQDSHLALLAVAQSLVREKCYWEAAELAELASVMFLRFRLLLAGGKTTTPHKDVKIILGKMRSYTVLSKRDYRSLVAMCVGKKAQAPSRAFRAIKFGKALIDAFPEITDDAENPARDFEEAKRFYRPITRGAHSALEPGRNAVAARSESEVVVR